MGVVEIRAMGDGDPAVISVAFSALGWPGRTVERYEGLLGQQRRGERDVFVATVDALMDAAEARAAERSAIVGLGVGLYADYGSAQRMYARRGYLPTTNTSGTTAPYTPNWARFEIICGRPSRGPCAECSAITMPPKTLRAAVR